jgi:uncharacterized protein (DUF1501 family)
MSLVVTRSDPSKAVLPELMHPLDLLAESSGGDYRAMVCLFLVGGSDSNNMLVPTDSRYAQYRRQRPNLAIEHDVLLPLHLSNTRGASYGLHPAMTGLQHLVNGGQAALVANVGPLIVPTTRQQWQQRSVPVPVNLFSHSDQQVAWQSSVVDGTPRSGWGGRLMERLLPEHTPRRGFSMLSVSGGNLWSTGDRGLQACRVRAQGRMNPALARLASSGAVSVAMTRAAAQLNQRRFAPVLDPVLSERPFERPFEPDDLDVVPRSTENRALLGEALEGVALDTVFPPTALGHQLSMVAQLISARERLGLTRQCFFCAIDGFDTHGDDQLPRQYAAFAEVSAAVASFHAATVEMGLAEQVTLFSASDFGRTFASNGQGTDHGWGSHQFVVGGAVQGGQLIGRFPDLALGGPDDAGNGVWIPTLATDQLGAEIGGWFGAGEDLLDEVFPSLRNFDRRIGLMTTTP